MCGGPQAFLPTLADFTERLTQAHPEWVALLLGGSPVFGQGGRNGRTAIAGVSNAGYVMQSHATLWRHTPRSAPFLEQILEQMAAGMNNDNAIPSRAYASFCPALVLQNPKIPSNLQVLASSGGQAGYDTARRLKKGMSKKAIAKVAMKRFSQRSSCSARGSHPLSKPALRRARAASGSRGSARKAGRGSTASDIQNKLKYMKNFVAKHKRFPSRKFALGK